ncbi:MAG: DNA primase [Hyphomicrobiaceae bacterium]|nr:DNA primase [Hyphomicrobiaceae bacterium]
MRYPPALLDEIKARLSVSQVVARKVALKRSGRELKGLSPFKVEKSPSFFVNDNKGAWFDFSSGQNGDIFKFLMLTEGVSFTEAVERLAEEAGVALPKATPEDRAVYDQRDRLLAVLEASARFFVQQLHGAAGLEARRYLERRGLAQAGIERFRLGYAPGGRAQLKEHLAKAGFTAEEMNLSGMLIWGEDIPVSYDRFRHRVMFPITDTRGRTIAFGGRALDPDAPAKYLNSPETPLFHKSHVLFNAANARQPAFDSGRIVVVEGYMDVIALSEAGFPATVAPLGTALTVEQVALLWRMAKEPVLCFDGDGAGRRAAFRAVETVLPHLKPGYSVQFAFLPDGLDPDDLVRQRGPDAFRDVLAKTAPLFDVLIEREEQAGPQAVTPEQRASLEARLMTLVGRIEDRSVRSQYERELRETLWAKNKRLIREIAAGGLGGGARGGASAQAAGRRRNNTQLDWRLSARATEKQRIGNIPRAAALSQAPVRSNELALRTLPLPPREVLLMRTLLNHPWLLEEECEAIADLTLTAEPLSGLRRAMLNVVSNHGSLDTEALRAHLIGAGFGSLVAAVDRISHRSDRFAEPDADRDTVEAGWRHACALHEMQVGLRRALAEAEQDYLSSQSEKALARIVDLQEQLARSASHHADLSAPAGGVPGSRES